MSSNNLRLTRCKVDQGITAAGGQGLPEKLRRVSESQGPVLQFKVEVEVEVGSGLQDINEEELAAPTQRRDLSEARALFGWLVNELGAGTLTQVAARCHRDLSSLSSGVQRLLARAEGDLTVVGRMKRLRSGW